MASRALIVPVLALSILLAIPAAQAALVITVEAPERGPEVLVGESGSVAFTVSTATTGDIVCPTDGTFTVTLAVGKTDDALGLSGAVEPTSMSFTLTQGVHSDTAGTSAPTDPQTGTATFTVDPSKLPPGHASHTISIVAEFDGSPIGTCQGELDAARSSVDVNFPIKQPVVANPTGPGSGATPSTPTENPSEPADEPKESPAPGAFMIAFIGLALAAMRRRK